MNKRTIVVISAVSLVLVVGVVAGLSASPAATFTVNSTLDATDVIPGNGICETAAGNGMCTLRAAVQETNALAGADTIIVPAGTYTLTIPGADEDGAATGDLDLNDDLVIEGSEVGETVVDGGQLDRVLHIPGPYAVDLANLTIRHGNSSAYGGGIDNYGNLTLSASAITFNQAIQGGGGVRNIGQLIVTDSLIADNIAFQGGGLETWGHTSLANVGVTRNEASGAGGILATYGSKLTIISSPILSNTASYDGGGIISNSGATLTMTSSTISHNVAGYYAGGIKNADYNSSVNLVNVTISHNEAGLFQGGGVSNTDQGTVTLLHVTIAYNSAVNGGAGVFNAGAGSTVEFKSTIVASNIGGNCAGNSSTTSTGFNLESGNTCGFTGPGDLINTDPLLGPLQDNGGPTRTHALLDGSPAIDAADNVDCPATDQRGAIRPMDGDNNGSEVCDIGSYEYGGGIPEYTYHLYLPSVIYDSSRVSGDDPK